MKKIVLDYLINIISKNSNYSSTKLNEIRYGLETLYITITKTIVIVFISILFNTYKTLLLLLLFYSLLRLFGSGLHASKSIYCWISSIIVFILFPVIIDNIIIRKNILILTSTICTFLILFHSPSDTKKRPMKNAKKRLIDKIICTTISLVYLILIIMNKNSYYCNILLSSQIIETSLILPISYRLFNLRYNNYKYLD